MSKYFKNLSSVNHEILRSFNSYRNGYFREADVDLNKVFKKAFLEHIKLLDLYPTFNDELYKSYGYLHLYLDDEILLGWDETGVTPLQISEQDIIIDNIIRSLV